MRAMSGMAEERAVRRTPYELVFGEGAFEEEHFPAIAAEAQERGVDATDPERFVMLASVGALLRDLPAEGEAAALHELGLLLFQGYHQSFRTHPAHRSGLRTADQALDGA